MNVNKPSAMAAWKPPASMGEVRGPATFDLVPKTTNIVGVTGLQRGILEYPEVKDEENDTDLYEPSAKYAKVSSFSESQVNQPSEARADKHVIRLTADQPSQTSTTSATSSLRYAAPTAAPATTTTTKDILLHRKIEINPAGIFKVSYSPEPATAYDSNGQHSHEEYDPSFTNL